MSRLDARHGDDPDGDHGDGGGAAQQRQQAAAAHHGAAVSLGGLAERAVHVSHHSSPPVAPRMVHAETQ